MPDLIPFNLLAGAVDRRPDRQTSRSLAALDSRRQLAIAQAQAQAEVQGAKADAITYVGKVAMQNAAMLAELESQLSGLVPKAAPRLRAIADITAIGLAEVVSETSRKLYW